MLRTITSPLVFAASITFTEYGVGQHLKDARADWLRANTAVIRTVDPAEEDFTDLAPLKDAIGTSRVVMLGEQSHGDGTVFLAKSRLVKFLHQEMGFEVLAFESGLFDCVYVEDAFERGESPDSAHQNGIFGIWALSNEAMPALLYSTSTRGTDRPLRIAGFDSQFTSAHCRDGFMPLIEDFFSRGATADLLPPLESEMLAVRNVLEWVSSNGSRSPPFPPLPDGSLDSIFDIVARIERERDAYASVHGLKRVGFVCRVLENLVAYARQFQTMRDKNMESINIRDRAMGESLLHLALTEYPDKKIIVWAATFHLLRNAELLRPAMGSATNLARPGIYPMGDWVWSALGDQVYSVMFTASRGRAGICWNPAFEIGEPLDGSIEQALDAVGPEYLFLDLRGTRARSDEASAWLRGEFAARPMGYAWEIGRWSECFDGIFYTKRMEKSTDRRRAN